MKRLDVVQNIPSPYRLHLFRELYRQLQAKGVEFHVHFMSDMSRGHEERPQSWHNPKIDFPHTYWKDYGYRFHHFNPGLIWYLLCHKVDRLLVGCVFDTFTGIATATLVRAKLKCGWTEGNTKTTGRMTGFVGWFKRFILARFQKIAVPGAEGARYVELHQSYTRLKMPSPVLLPNLIDETRFRPRSAFDQREIDALRSALGCTRGVKLCLIPARLEWYKGLIEFVKALPTDLLADWKILIMGSGTLKQDIEAVIEASELRDVILIKELIPYDEMPRYYAAADLFLLPSLMDRNPLSVVEALHAGLPVAVSSCAGNVDEAVADHENGWVLDVKNETVFARQLREVFSCREDQLRTMGAVSLRVQSQFWNSKRAIAAFIEAIQ